MFTKNNVQNGLRNWDTNSDGTSNLRNTIRSKIYDGDENIGNRLVKAQLYWKFYNNNHWYKNDDKLLSFNYTRAIIDKVNNFMASENGFEFNITDTYGEQVPLELKKAHEGVLEYNWQMNKRKTFLKKLLQMGGITGDAYVFLNPKLDKGYVEYEVMDTRTCIPQFENGDYKRVIGYRVVQQLGINDAKFIQKVYLYTKEETLIYFVRETGEDAVRYNVTQIPNPYGFLPIIHIENIPMSDSYGGRSDVEDIVKINKVYNELAVDIKTIIDYYAQPTTVITGGNAGNLKRGIGQIWSGLPSEASVFNLTLGEDLSASNNFLDKLKQAMHDLSGVPEEVLSKVQHISNTSSSALRMLYQSLVQIADIKAITYGEGLMELHKLTLLLYDRMDELRAHQLYQKFLNEANKINTTNGFQIVAHLDRYVTDIKFKYALPNDRTVLLNEAQMELSMKIGSRQEIMERLGKSNIPLLLKQIDEDMQYNQKYESNKLDSTNKSEVPNSLDDIASTEDNVDIT